MPQKAQRGGGRRLRRWLRGDPEAGKVSTTTEAVVMVAVAVVVEEAVVENRAAGGGGGAERRGVVEVGEE